MLFLILLKKAWLGRLSLTHVLWIGVAENGWIKIGNGFIMYMYGALVGMAGRLGPEAPL